MVSKADIRLILLIVDKSLFQLEFDGGRNSPRPGHKRYPCEFAVNLECTKEIIFERNLGTCINKLQFSNKSAIICTTVF